MNHRRVFVLPILAMVLVAASACGGHQSGRSSLGTTPHRAGAAPIAPGPGAPIGQPVATATLIPTPVYEDFLVKPVVDSANHPLCSWTAGGNGTIVVNVQITLVHTGGIPGHQPTSVNFHIADLGGARSAEYTSGFTTGTFGINEPVANFERNIALNVELDLSAPDSVPSNDNLRMVVDVLPGTLSDWTPYYGTSASRLSCYAVVG